MIDKKLYFLTLLFSTLLLGISFCFGEYYVISHKPVQNTQNKKYDHKRLPASVGGEDGENVPPIMDHFKTLSYVAEGCAHSFSPELDVDCGEDGHMIHLYVAWDPSFDGKTSAKPWLILNKKKIGEFVPTALNINKPGTHEYYSVCTGTGKLKVHIPTKCSEGLSYSVRIDEDGYVKAN